jgi:hypothetical protein
MMLGLLDQGAVSTCLLYMTALHTASNIAVCWG